MLHQALAKLASHDTMVPLHEHLHRLDCSVTIHYHAWTSVQLRWTPTDKDSASTGLLGLKFWHTFLRADSQSTSFGDVSWVEHHAELQA